MPKKSKNKPITPKPKPQKDSNNLPTEIGGPKGPEPTRHGDWHIKGRVSDF